MRKQQQEEEEPGGVDTLDPPAENSADPAEAVEPGGAEDTPPVEAEAEVQDTLLTELEAILDTLVEQVAAGGVEPEPLRDEAQSKIAELIGERVTRLKDEIAYRDHLLTRGVRIGATELDEDDTSWLLRAADRFRDELKKARKKLKEMGCDTREIDNDLETGWRVHSLLDPNGAHPLPGEDPRQITIEQAIHEAVQENAEGLREIAARGGSDGDAGGEVDQQQEAGEQEPELAAAAA